MAKKKKKTKTIKVRRLCNMQPYEVALVPGGANGRPFAVVKSKETPMNLDPKKIHTAIKGLTEVKSVLDAGKPDAAAQASLAAKVRQVQAGLLEVLPSQALDVTKAVEVFNTMFTELEDAAKTAQGLDLALAEQVEGIKDQLTSLVDVTKEDGEDEAAAGTGEGEDGGEAEAGEGEGGGEGDGETGEAGETEEKPKEESETEEKPAGEGESEAGTTEEKPAGETEAGEGEAEEKPAGEFVTKAALDEALKAFGEGLTTQIAEATKAALAPEPKPQSKDDGPVNVPGNGNTETVKQEGAEGAGEYHMDLSAPEVIEQYTKK